ncbi:uncharacterized protein L203_105369 [Cryptococcus depauperatus CBS 7841]|uniref:Uncharacterized protein n=1 Tax=Cryptococcus depauperatus CBS 7841 TaxID=1295531 RepID=A0A1E3ICK1_9TREE|nr:hypothetical protein L203_04044 [Cryptococcus depauperatus CBS 7841]
MTFSTTNSKLKVHPSAPVQTAEGNKTIRSQSKKEKSAVKQDTDERAELSKDVQKAVLASPLTVAWPNISRHLQTTVLHRLKELIPAEVAEYHVSRARCHQKSKRRKRACKNADKKVETNNANSLNPKDPTVIPIEMDSCIDDIHLAREELETNSEKKRKRAIGEQEKDLPRHGQKPKVLSCLVFGINEVIKALERQIDELKLQILVMGDALNADQPGRPFHKDNLLPTAPRSSSPFSDNESSNNDDQQSHQRQSTAPVNYIIVPLFSINPQALVNPIPQYCANYNALVYQHAQLSKTVRTRIKKTDLGDIIGEEREEVRVVPLGNVEKELAEMAGLRRLASIGLRLSHPAINRIRDLLPKNVLHPPRYSITLPYPTSNLTIHADGNDKITPSQVKENIKQAAKGSSRPIPLVHYAPLHVKGIMTKMPVDSAARKAKRIEQVRKKRTEAKMKKAEKKAKGQKA